MKKYYIGLIVLAVLTLGLTVYVIGIGGKAKDDTKTEKSANEIATKLNDYISKNNRVPASLDAAGIKDVPSSITYSKKSDEKYEFCVTYKADKGYGSADASNLLTGALMGGMYGGAAGNFSDSSSTSSYEPSSLYLNYTHKKGKDCQTVKPYIQTYTSSSQLDDYCKPTNQYYSFYKSYCKNGVLTY